MATAHATVTPSRTADQADQNEDADCTNGGLQPYANQVGGHITSDGLPSSLTNGSGRFYKQLQAGERGAREVAFYEAMQLARREALPAAAGPSSAGQAHLPAAQQEDVLMAQLASFVARSYGTTCVQGHTYLLLQDLCAQYQQPCILDAKIGLRTWYPWASDELKAKYRAKDESSTQCTLGFRLCGARVFNCIGGEVWQVDRHWGKKLAPADIPAALARFADNGALRPSDIYGGPHGVLAQLDRLIAIFGAQASWRLYSASVLLLYEGAARGAGEAAVSVALVDFAHAFSVGSGSSGDGAPTGRDENVLAGLHGLRRAVQELLAS